jgi:hypothetical protein
MAYLWPLVRLAAIICIYYHAPKFDVNWQIIDWTALTDKANGSRTPKKGDFSSYAESAAPWL